MYINETGLYILVLRSKAPHVEAITVWICEDGLLSLKEYVYDMSDAIVYQQVYKHPKGENALHYRLIDHTRQYLPEVILVLGLGENEATSYMIVDSRRNAMSK